MLDAMTVMTVVQIREYLTSDRCHGAYAKVRQGQDTAMIPIKVECVLDWLDLECYADDDRVTAQVIHGGTALAIGGPDELSTNLPQQPRNPIQPPTP
jgi:hypothetical protein